MIACMKHRQPAAGEVFGTSTRNRRSASSGSGRLAVASPDIDRKRRPLAVRRVAGCGTEFWAEKCLVAIRSGEPSSARRGRGGCAGTCFHSGDFAARRLLFGIVPALQMFGLRMIDSLRQGARGAGMALRQHRFLSGLVVSEFALSVVLIVGAGLLLRSFWNVLKVDPGLNPSHLVVAHVWLPVPNDPNTDPYRATDKKTAFAREVLRRVSALSGVEASGRRFRGNAICAAAQHATLQD